MLGSRHRDEHAEAGNVMQTTREYRRHLASDWDTETLEVVLAAARQEAARGVRRLGLTRADREDLQQDILIVLIERCRHFNPERATWAAYVGLVARHVIADRARALRETFQPAFEGLDIDAFPAGASVTQLDQEDADLALDLARVTNELPAAPQEMLRLLVATGDVGQAQHRSTLSTAGFYRALADLRCWLRASGLRPHGGIRRCTPPEKNPWPAR